MKVLIVCERPTYYRADLFNLLTDQLGSNLSFYFISNQKQPIRDKISVFENEPFLNQAFFFNQGPIVLRNIKALNKIFRLNPDVIINVGLSLRTVFLLTFARLCRKKLITWWAGTITSEKNINSIHTLYRKFLIRLIDGAIAYSPLAAEYLHMLTPALKNIQVIGNNSFDSSHLNQQISRLRPNSTHDSEIRILTVGFINQSKNIISLLKAYDNLKKKCPALCLVVAGDGPELKNLRQYSRAKTICGVCFKGFVPPEKMVEEYAAADIYVHPSLLDRWPQTFNEAASAGLPILISSTSGVCNQYTETFGREVIFEPEDSGRIEEMLLELINSESRRKELGAKALVSALQNDCKIVAKKIITYISAL